MMRFRVPQIARQRLAAFGAAAIVTLAAGAVVRLAVADTSGSNDLVLVPVTPCRLLDTATGAGAASTRKTAVNTAQFAVTVEGVCGIPVEAQAVDLTVTVASGPATALITIWPSDATRPRRESFAAGGRKVVTLTVPLSATGQLSFRGSAGSTHLAIDVTAFRAPHDHDDRYDIKAEADAQIAAVQGAAGPAGDTGPTGPQGPQVTGPTGPAGSPGYAPGHVVAAIPAAGTVGQYTSIAIGTDGFPIVSYESQSAVPGVNQLRVTHCNNIACGPNGSTTTPIVVSATTGGSHSAIAIGSDGLPVISFAQGGLTVVHCTVIDCSTYVGNLVAAGNVDYTSVAIGVDGNPVVTYRDVAAAKLKAVFCANVACTAAAAVRTLGDDGRYGSVAIGGDGRPIISFYNAGVGGGDPTVVHCVDLVELRCPTSGTVTVPGANDVGRYSSITLGNDGLAIASFYDVTANSLVVAHEQCALAPCDPFTLQSATVATGGQYSAISIGSDGLPVISSRDAIGNALQVTHCNDVACLGGDESTVVVDRPAGATIAHTSITVGVDGFPVISYTDQTTKALKIVHCSNVFCTPFTRAN